MKLAWLLIFSFVYTTLFAQKSDTAWWEKGVSIQSITQKKDNYWNIRCWHRNGRPMCEGTFFLKNALIPVTDITIIDSNGHKLQEYIVSEGTLVNYLPKGKIKDVLRSPLKDTAERYTEYYTNKKVKQLKFARKDTGRNGIFFFYPDYNRKVSFMYQQEGSAIYHYQQFYPNGKIYWQQVFYRDQNYKIFTAWYKENGEVDTTCYIDKGKSGYSNDKVGRRLEWWNNGRLKSEEYFKANYNDSVSRSWHENGKLQLEKFFVNGSQTGILRLWNADGKLKYYADYRNNSTGKPSLNFHDNGNIATQDNDIISVYDINGILTYESISIGRYSRSFDFRYGTPNNNTYTGRFDKMRKGKWMAYDDKGRIIYAANYKNGLLDGKVLLYDTSGSINTYANYFEGRLDGEFLAMSKTGMDTLMYGFYDMGRKTGVWRMFFDDGQLQSVQLYNGKDYYELENYDQNGKAIAASRYDKEEQAFYQYQYRNGRLTTMSVKHETTGGFDYYNYFENGQVSQLSLYDKEGGYLRKTYYENGQQESEAFFKKGGFSEGKQYRWHKNGNKKLEGEMINGYQEGEWIIYNEDGTIESTHQYKKGIEQIQPPANMPCFCDKAMPAIAGSSFFNSAGSYIDLKMINNVMRRFQLDSAFEYTFVRCNYCWPLPIIAVREQKLWVGKEGMHLSLTPCMHGSNRALVNFASLEFNTLEREYHDYDNEEELVKPISLAEVFNRAIAVFDRNEAMNYDLCFYNLTGDTGYFRKFLKKVYKVDLPLPEEDVDAETLAVATAEEKYYEGRGEDGNSFNKHFSRKLSEVVLPYFPEEAKVLAKDSTNRQATLTIFNKFFEQHEPQYFAEKLYGSMEAVLDSGTVALKMPSSFIAAWDSLAGKKFVEKGKPVDVPFMISFKKAMYASYPSDHFAIPEDETISKCVAPFTIANTGVWMQVNDFRYSLGKPGDEERYSAADAYSPYNYPAHCKNLRVRFSDMYRKIDADLDEYIQDFMGVVLGDANMHVPGINETVHVQDVIIDAKEINGSIKIPVNDVRFSEVQLKRALESAGFTVFNRNYELDKSDDPMIILYFHLRVK